jgi:hypothetical protein
MCRQVHAGLKPHLRDRLAVPFAFPSVPKFKIISACVGLSRRRCIVLSYHPHERGYRTALQCAEPLGVIAKIYAIGLS